MYALSRFSSPLRWAGGKKWLVESILEFVEHTREVERIVELFAGGASLSFSSDVKSVLINDVNVHLINFYQHLQAGLSLTIDLTVNEQQYLQHREKFNTLIMQGRHRSKLAAELFFYLNRTCFNGLCRFNRDGLFNVPFGRKTSEIGTIDFESYQEKTQGWQFRRGDFSGVETAEQDLVFVDPPYLNGFSSYAKENFTLDDHVRLIDLLRQTQGIVISTNGYSTKLQALYEAAGFATILAYAPRSISSKGDRAMAAEIIAIKARPKYRELFLETIRNHHDEVTCE